MKIAIALIGLLAGVALSLSSCGQSAKTLTCPDLASVAPPAIGAGYLGGLTGRLAGGDRANSIYEAVFEIHRRVPSIDADGLTNILIAADCPNVRANPALDDAAIRDRIATFRAQVGQALDGNAP